MAIRNLFRHLSQRVIVEPQLLNILEFLNPGAQLHDVVEAEVETDQVRQFEHLGQHQVQIHLRQM